MKKSTGALGSLTSQLKMIFSRSTHCLNSRIPLTKPLLSEEREDFSKYKNFIQWIDSSITFDAQVGAGLVGVSLHRDLSGVLEFDSVDDEFPLLTIFDDLYPNHKILIEFFRTTFGLQWPSVMKNGSAHLF